VYQVSGRKKRKRMCATSAKTNLKPAKQSSVYNMDPTRVQTKVVSTLEILDTCKDFSIFQTFHVQIYTYLQKLMQIYFYQIFMRIITKPMHSNVLSWTSRNIMYTFYTFLCYYGLIFLLFWCKFYFKHNNISCSSIFIIYAHYNFESNIIIIELLPFIKKRLFRFCIF